MEKVKLPREVAEAIERTISKHSTWNNNDLCYIVLNQSGYCQYANDQDISLIHKWSNTREYTFVNALIFGYEVLETPEDKVRELYEYFGQGNERNYVNYAGKDVQNKIQIILKTLGIKIEGVNA